MNNIEKNIDWLNDIKNKTHVSIEKITFDGMDQWNFDCQKSSINHITGKFFSVIGIDVSINDEYFKHWSQPIIDQSEIGILGIIAKKIDKEVYFLMQAKIEPGNINYTQLSPTLQATKSNYTKVHKGKRPPYIEQFEDSTNKVLIDQLQSEQGSMFLSKRNRNIIIMVDDEIPVYENYHWLKLEEIVAMLSIPNTVNMDTRSVISSMLFWDFEMHEQDQYPLHSLREIIIWLTKLKTDCLLEVKKKPLKNLPNWIITNDSIYHDEQKFFEVIPVKVSIEGREVKNWTQPMIKAKHEGIYAFIIKRINGVFHVLVQGKVECGNFDIVEMAPTVQCLLENYNEVDLQEYPYLDYVLNAKQDEIIYDVLQSEEGGRFYHVQNRNMIVEVDESFPEVNKKNFIWLTLKQIQNFLMFNNFFNIQARSLISALITKENEFS